MLLGKVKLNTIEVLISKVLIELYISHDEFILVNNVLREFNGTKEETKKPLDFYGIYYINMVDITREAYKKMV